MITKNKTIFRGYFESFRGKCAYDYIVNNCKQIK